MLSLNGGDGGDLFFLECVCVLMVGERLGWATDSGREGGNSVRWCTTRVEEVEDMDIMENMGIVQT